MEVMRGVANTTLARLIAMRRRYKAQTDLRSPSGAPMDQWLKWRDWVAARRDQYDAAIRAAKEEKRFNQRRKANERKRDRNPNCRGR